MKQTDETVKQEVKKDIMQKNVIFNGVIDYTRDDKETVGLVKLADENGFDLRANKKAIFRPYSIMDINTGLSFKIPEGHELKVMSTVNVLKKVGLMPLGGCVSITNLDGELIVPMQNITPRMIIIERGMPLGRILIESINNFVSFKEVEKKIEEHDL
jgi:dUTPase